MPSNIILECSERDSTSTTDNSTWVTTFSEAVPIVSGDTIQMKTALINTRSATSGSIIIPTDLVLTMTVAYYENRRAVASVAGTPYAGVDGQIANNTLYDQSLQEIIPPTPASNKKGFYMLRTETESGDNFPLYTQDVTYTLEAGAYLPQDLASVITNKMYTTLDTSLGGSSPGLMISPATESINAYAGGQQVLSGLDESVQGRFNYQPVSLLGKGDTGTDGFNYMNCMVYPFVGASNTTLDFVNGRFQFNNLHSPYFQPQHSAGQDIYSIESLNVARGADVTVNSGVKNVNSNSSTLILTFTSASEDFLKFKTGMTVTGITAAGVTFTTPAVYVTGIVNGISNGIGVYQVDLQTSSGGDFAIGAGFIGDKDGVPNSVLLPLHLSDGSMVSHHATTGVLITNLKSEGDNNAFWSNLGFSSSIYYDDTVMKSLGSVSAKTKYIESKATGQVLQNPNLNSTFSSMLSSYPIFGGDIQNPNALEKMPQEFYDQQATTKGLLADDTYVLDTTGYYLLEVIANFDTEYKRNDGRQSSIVGVISKQYNASDYVTGYLDSSIPYTHQGSPQSLSNFTVRVIDPSTKEPVKGLGGNSTVFMEIVKAPPAAVQKER